MPIQQAEDKILFHELPRSIGVLDGLVILCGKVMAGAGVYVYFSSPEQTILLPAGIGLLGIVLMLNPVYDLFRASLTATLDHSSRRLLIDRKSVFKSVREEYRFEEISRFAAEKDMDVDSPSNRWEIRTVLKSGNQFVIPHSGTRDLNLCEEVARCANKLLQ